MSILEEARETLRWTITTSTSPVMIKYNGNILILGSGKSVWTSERNAKLALRHHLELSAYNNDEEAAWQQILKEVEFVHFIEKVT